jgi:hypothetical protein
MTEKSKTSTKYEWTPYSADASGVPFVVALYHAISWFLLPVLMPILMIISNILKKPVSLPKITYEKRK